MELKDFVKNVLKDVTEAVQENHKELGREMYLDTNKDMRTVEFDIAVTVEDSTTGTGKGGIKVFQLIEAGGEVSREAKNSSISRIKFGVYVDKHTEAESRQLQALQDAAMRKRNQSFR